MEFHLTNKISGKTLVAWGFTPDSWFGDGIVAANRMVAAGCDQDMIFKHLQTLVPVAVGMRTNSLPYSVFVDPENESERANLEAVNAHMDALMRVPTIVSGAVMPDACPSGSNLGTIPVGGAVVTRDAIHPGFHSADICCSMAVSIFRRADDLKRILDVVQASTHFGPGGRPKMIKPDFAFMKDFENNPFLKGLEGFAVGHFMTQGDGNHFAYVGRLRSTGKPALVTHHGSRGLGAQLFKRGMLTAKRHTAIHAPKVPSHNAWIDASSNDGRSYWAALQTVREWTRENHFGIHRLVSSQLGNKIDQQFWNEHNFVFRRDDGLYYHGKGATPSWKGFSPDDSGRTLIPLNMSEPILITEHRDPKGSLGFAPHGAGRNFSRTQHLAREGGGLDAELAALQAKGLDVRAFCGTPDHSELPSAYKNAAAVRKQIGKYDLARIVDEIEPYGSIMAGNWRQEALWKQSGRNG
jgi:tRNA-splicing ligase RtcB